MSSVRALKTIKVHNWGFSRLECIDLANRYMDFIRNKYPLGIEPNNYFVIPGYEHVTKNQPIIIYNGVEGEYKLSTANLFKL